MGSLAGLSGSQADAYKDARPTYPSSWFKMLAEKTTHHKLAWDVGSGNGQAAKGAAEYYERVVATDISEEQLQRAIQHPRITYCLTPESMSEDELVARVGGANSIDLVTAAQAVHYFDIEKFYAVVKRVLRKPGGVIAVWVFNEIVISPAVDRVFKHLADSTIPFRTPRTDIALAGYKTLPFPFKSVGIGSEGNPMPLECHKQLSRDGFLAYLRSWQLIVKAKKQGVDLLPDKLIEEIIAAWGSSLVKNVVYKVFMIAGTCDPKAFGQVIRIFRRSILVVDAFSTSISDPTTPICRFSTSISDPTTPTTPTTPICRFSTSISDPTTPICRPIRHFR